MSNTSLEKNTTVCADCGKGEEASIDLKSCAACRLVKYCSRDCQAAHRPQHKKECKKKAAELHDEKLFEQPPPLEDCPICMIRLPTLETGRTYTACCGKIICSGCVYAFQSRAARDEDDVCPFCRTQAPATDEEDIELLEKRAAVNDALAIYQLGIYYAEGTFGLSPDYAKALELYHRAGELGNTGAYLSIGNAYHFGRGVRKDDKKAIQYTKLAARGGNANARHNLGVSEHRAGNYNRALKHWIIAARDGHSGSLKGIKTFYSHGCATKDDYAKALRSYQVYLDEIKSDQRDEAAAFRDEYKYLHAF